MNRTPLTAACIGLAALLAWPVAAHAEAPKQRKAPAVQKNTKEKRANRRELRNDRADLARLVSLKAEYDKARNNRNKPRLTQLDKQVLAEMRVEAGESRTEVRKDRAELRRSKAEVAKSRRQTRKAAAAGKPVETAKERRDLKDDRADKRDDRRDLSVEKKKLEALKRIKLQFKGLSGKQDPASINRKFALITEYEALARSEIKQDKKETREDRRERREDRRQRKP